jgi:hypothetical protein
MAEANSFRWTTLRVAALYPFVIPPWALASIFNSFFAIVFAPERRSPGGAALVGLIVAGVSALALTRSFDVDWPAWSIAPACYVAGGVAAGAVFGYIELVRSEFPPKRG